MILVDRHGHMVSDSGLAELHRFAHRIGLKQEWFQNHAVHPHYDLTTKRKIDQAIKAGAILVRPRQVLIAAKQLAEKSKPIKDVPLP